MPFTERDASLFDPLDETTSPGLSQATVRKVLADRQRRKLLRYLHDHDGPVEIEVIIDQLTHHERQPATSATAAALLDNVTTAVWTVHLPLLAAHDIVRYDRQSGMVRWWRNAGQLTTHLEDSFQ